MFKKYKVAITLWVVLDISMILFAIWLGKRLFAEEEIIQATQEIQIDDDSDEEIIEGRNEMQLRKDGVLNSYEIIEGKLYGWGENNYGQLGLGKVDDLGTKYTEPVYIADSIIHVDTYIGETVVFLNDKSELYGIGNNMDGQLGVPIEQNGRSRSEKQYVTEPTLIATNVRYAAVGLDFILVLKKDGKLYVMGDNGNGQLGDGEAKPDIEREYDYDNTPFSYELKYVMGGVAYIACGGQTAAAISYNGELWMWGDNSHGEVGNRIVGNKMPVYRVNIVSKPYLTMKQVEKVWFDKDTVYAETDTGETWVWGEGYAALPKKIED